MKRKTRANTGLWQSLPAGVILLLALDAIAAEAPAPLTLNDKEYFAARGLDVLVFSNWYDGLFSDSKISGIELIHHGMRTATYGDVRLNATPEQWDLIPQFVERKVDRRNNTIEAFLRYPQFNFDYSIRARIDGDDVVVTVNLPRELPAELAGKAGLNLEFLPSAYFGKSWMMDDSSGLLPLYPTGAKEQNDKVAPEPLARGSQLARALAASRGMRTRAGRCWC